MPSIRDLLHADRVLKLMAMDIPYPTAVGIDDDSAGYLIEAWEIDGDIECMICSDMAAGKDAKSA